MDSITLLLIIIVIIVTIAMVTAYIRMRKLINEAVNNADKLNEDETEELLDENFSD